MAAHVTARGEVTDIDKPIEPNWKPWTEPASKPPVSEYSNRSGDLGDYPACPSSYVLSGPDGSVGYYYDGHKHKTNAKCFRVSSD